MRILFIANDFPTPVSPNKAVFNRALVRALAAAGHAVEVIAPIPWSEERAGRRVPPGRRESVGGIEVQYPRYLYPPKLLRNHHGRFYAASIRSAVRRSLDRGKPEVVLSYWVYPDGDAAVRAAARAGAASAVIVGGSDVLLLPKTPSRRRRVQGVLRRVDHVITVNQHLKTATAALGVDPAKISVWSQGIDPSHFHPGDAAAARARLKWTDPNPLLLWVGRMVPVKGLEVLIEAAGLLRDDGTDFRLALVGDGPLRESVAADCAARGLGSRVTFVGNQSSAQLGDWYRAADRVLLSSWSEGLPNVLREAQACGTPFIASDVGGISEIAGVADRLIPAGNAASLAATIRQSLAAPPCPVGAAPTTWAQSAEAMVTLLDRIPRPPSPEHAPPWTPRQLARRLTTGVLPRRVVLSGGPARSGEVCLTFDDGPHPGRTPALLDVLRAHNAVATFFVIGSRAARCPDLLRRITAEGHTLAYHTYTHGEPGAVSAALLSRELEQTADLFRALGVSAAPLFRPPLGKLSPAKLWAAFRAGLTTVLWSRDSKDYLPGTNPQQLQQRFACRPLLAGDVVLFHDTVEATAVALPQILASVKAAGLRFTTPDRWLRAPSGLGGNFPRAVPS